jgi:hypothetical protein
MKTLLFTIFFFSLTVFSQTTFNNTGIGTTSTPGLGVPSSPGDFGTTLMDTSYTQRTTDISIQDLQGMGRVSMQHHCCTRNRDESFTQCTSW